MIQSPPGSPAWVTGYRALRPNTIDTPSTSPMRFGRRVVDVGSGCVAAIGVEGVECLASGVEVGVCSYGGGDAVAVELAADGLDDVGQQQADAALVQLLLGPRED